MSQSRYPQPKEQGKCIGCGAELPKPKKSRRTYQWRTWCSKQCRLEHCGMGFQAYVKHRAKGYCEMCGKDLLQLWCQELREEMLIDTKRMWLWDSRTGGYIHHIVPYAKGGAHHVSNLQLLCSNCHKLAHKKLREYPVQSTPMPISAKTSK